MTHEKRQAAPSHVLRRDWQTVSAEAGRLRGP